MMEIVFPFILKIILRFCVFSFLRQLGQADLIIEEQVVRPHPQAGRQVFLYIESVLRVEIRKVLIYVKFGIFT